MAIVVIIPVPVSIGSAAAIELAQHNTQCSGIANGQTPDAGLRHLAAGGPGFDDQDDASGGEDDYVSVEVAPSLARDTPGTIEAARHLSTTIAQPNLYVKIPGTAEGLPAIRQMISEGRSINVTLLFSLERYAEVIEAYIAGLEAAGVAVTSGVRRARST